MYRHLLLASALLLSAALGGAVRADPLTEDVTSARQPYPFVPLGATLFDEVFGQNFVDLETGPGLLDFTGGAATVNGSTGEDFLLPSFAVEDIGVPVFAALDGTVSQAVYTDRADHVTAGGTGQGNYVLLDHGAGQGTGYFSLAYNNGDARYEALRPGQFVKAGTQIGLVGSSGLSTAPHLHFQSTLNGAIFEPFAGAARPGPSWWVTQPALRTETYVEAYAISPGTITSPAPNSDLPRQGAFAQGATQTGCWAILHNLPAGSQFRLRWLRPDGSVYRSDAGPLTFAGSNLFQRTVRYYWNYTWNPGLDAAGTWHLELTLNGSLVQTAPFDVTSASQAAQVQVPYNISASFDGTNPTASDAVFCRIQTLGGQDGAPAVQSPDSSLVHYRYQWSYSQGTASFGYVVYDSNGSPVSGSSPPSTQVLIRDVVSAGRADAIPWGSAPVGAVLSCTVTPISSTGAQGQFVVVSATLGERTPVQVAVGPDNAPRLLWVKPGAVGGEGYSPATPADQTSLWRVNPDGAHTLRTYGPYPNWSPTALAVGPDNMPHLLYDNADGTLSLWSVNAVGTPSFTNYGPFSGWAAKGIAVDPSNRVHILWTNTSGQMSLWTVGANGSYTHAEYGPFSGYSAQSLAIGPDGAPRVLWANTNGSISLWHINTAGAYTHQEFGPFSGWTATAFAAAPDGSLRLLWDKTDGTMSLWNLNGAGSYTHAEYGPYPGWTARGLGVGVNGHPRIVWTSTSGESSLWDVDASGSFTFKNYGL